MSYNTLANFDMAFAILPSTINKELQLLCNSGTLPTSWNVSLNPNDPDKPPSIHVTLNAPSIKLITDSSSFRQVEVTIPFANGTFSYYLLDTNSLDADGKPTAMPKAANLNGASVVLTVNMSLADVRDKLVSQSKAIPKEVSDQLTRFDTTMFDIQHLFLDFEDAHLIESYKLVGLNNPDLNTAEATAQFRAVFQSLLNTFKGRDNPFILGYTVTNKPATPTTNSAATFDPTGATFSVPQLPFEPFQSTLDFLLMTGGKAVPGVGGGILNQHLIPTPSREDYSAIESMLIISQDVLMNHLLSIVAPMIQVSPNDFKPAEDDTLSLAVGNDKGGNTTCTVTPWVGAPKISFDFNVTFSQDHHDSLGSYIGYTDGYAKWTSTFFFTIDANSNITIGVTSSPVEKHAENHSNALGDFEGFLSSAADDILTFGQSNFFEDLSNNDWHVDFNIGFDAALSGLKERIFLPSGNPFTSDSHYLDAVILEGGHLGVGIYAKAPVPKEAIGNTGKWQHW